MLASAKNFDVICFQLKNTYFSQLNSPLKKDLIKLLSETKDIISSGKKIKPQLDAILPQIFSFRIKAIKWLLADGQDNLLNMLDEVVPRIEELRTNPQLEVLSENILFALRCNRRVIEVIMSAAINDNSDFEANFSELPEITYQQFIASMALGIPGDEAVQKIINLTNASLYIEFVVVSASIIYSDKLKTSDKTVNELAFLIADAAQEYSAIAAELGILTPRLKGQNISQISFDKGFIKEQQQLANLGLDDYAANLSE